MSEDREHRPRAGRGRWLLALLAVLVPLVPIVIALTITGSSTRSSGSTRGEAAAATGAPRAPGGTGARRHGLDLPSGHGALVAFITHPQVMRAAPGGRRIATLATRTSFGSPESAWVRQVRGGWLGVVNVAAGNGRLGWIRRDAGIALAREDWSIHVTLAGHALEVVHDGHAVRRYSVATGMPSAPTPAGSFAVTDRLRTGESGGPYGCCILALSATAPHAISDWDGGNRIAIHAYPITSTIGESVSHGCLHVTDAEGEWLISHVPLGTPVVISSA